MPLYDPARSPTLLGELAALAEMERQLAGLEALKTRFAADAEAVTRLNELLAQATAIASDAIARVWDAYRLAE